MNDQQLERCLQSIGKGCFVTFFEEVYDRAIPDETVARHIADGGRDYSVALKRVRSSQRIIDAERARDALINCANSKRLPLHIRDKATILAESIQEVR